MKYETVGSVKREPGSLFTVWRVGGADLYVVTGCVPDVSSRLWRCAARPATRSERAVWDVLKS